MTHPLYLPQMMASASLSQPLPNTLPVQQELLTIQASRAMHQRRLGLNPLASILVRSIMLVIDNQYLH